MKRNTAILLTLVLALPCLAIAATDSAVAYASYTLIDTVELNLYWGNTGNETQDFGAVPMNTILSDTLNVWIIHNMGATTPMQLSVAVDKTVGPDDDGMPVVSVNEGTEFWEWTSGNWGYTHTFFNTYQGDISIHVPLSCDFVVGTMPATTYAYDITVTVTSL